MIICYYKTNGLRLFDSIVGCFEIVDAHDALEFGATIVVEAFRAEHILPATIEFLGTTSLNNADRIAFDDVCSPWQFKNCDFKIVSLTRHGVVDC